MSALCASSPPHLPAEEVLLDENEEAKRHTFYMVAGFEVSPDHK
jgi:protease II